MHICIPTSVLEGVLSHCVTFRVCVAARCTGVMDSMRARTANRDAYYSAQFSGPSTQDSAIRLSQPAIALPAAPSTHQRAPSGPGKRAYNDTGVAQYNPSPVLRDGAHVVWPTASGTMPPPPHLPQSIPPAAPTPAEAALLSRGMRLHSPVIISRLNDLMSRYPEGVLVSVLPNAYQAQFREPLDLGKVNGGSVKLKDVLEVCDCLLQFKNGTALWAFPALPANATTSSNPAALKRARVDDGRVTPEFTAAVALASGQGSGQHPAGGYAGVAPSPSSDLGRQPHASVALARSISPQPQFVTKPEYGAMPMAANLPSFASPASQASFGSSVMPPLPAPVRAPRFTAAPLTQLSASSQPAFEGSAGQQYPSTQESVVAAGGPAAPDLGSYDEKLERVKAIIRAEPGGLLIHDIYQRYRDMYGADLKLVAPNKEVVMLHKALNGLVGLRHRLNATESRVYYFPANATPTPPRTPK